MCRSHPIFALLSFLVIPRPRRSTLFPYTTLFRSEETSVKVFFCHVELFNKGMKIKITLQSRPQHFLSREFQRPSQVILMSLDRKSTRLNSSHSQISYAVFRLKKKTTVARQHSDPP